MSSQYIFDAIGTSWQVDIEDNILKEKENFILSEIKNRIVLFDKTYSRFRSDSLVTQMSKTSGDFVLPDDAGKMLEIYRKMYDLTSGQMTPLVGQMLSDAGYDAEYSLVQKKELSKPLLWDEAMIWNDPKLTILVPTLLDFGAVGKGYLIDIVSETLEQNGIKSYCVDAGGDMRQKNIVGKKLRIGLEKPDDLTEVVGTVDLLNQSLCASSGNRRAWGNFHHIMDPEKLISADKIKAVWVLANTTLLADALSTALYFASPEILEKNFDFEYFIINQDDSIDTSAGFGADVFR